MRGYGLKEKFSSIYFCRIIIPAFHAGYLFKGSNNYRIAFTNLTYHIPTEINGVSKTKPVISQVIVNHIPITC